ncbi:hypothetical protein ACK8P5_26045 (plasmid) [Paenibacillus sp. EC2-1]|uniref:hypothetical protein n=1 Tax=Paenibacillus sp. EC2-1 TaxID=3388665 RepID=UPI003BEF3F09
MKKKRHRTWWYPAFQKELDKIRISGKIQKTTTITNDGGTATISAPALYDRKDEAYAVATSKRFEAMRDVDGKVITNDEGYARLEDLGRITLIGIRGKAINWKTVSEVPPLDGMKGERIVVMDELSTHSTNIDKVFEETDEMYARYANSPIARAGGIAPVEVKELGTSADETVPTEAEQGASA